MPSSHLDHARHDATLIAAHAAGDLSDTDRARAERLIATCESCAALRRDLVAIAAATRSLPAPMTAGRDFQLVPTQAERLRRGSWLRNVLRPFGAPRTAVRPMAAAFTSLGVAGLFVALVLPGVMLSPAAPSSAQRDLVQEAARTNAPLVSDAPAGGPGDGVHPVSQGSPDGAFGGYLGSGEGTGSTDNKNEGNATQPPQVAEAGGEPTAERDANGGTFRGLTLERATFNPLLVGSVALLILGLLLFTLLFAARRTR